MRRFCDEGHDIQAARDMREALLERPVKGVTVAVCEMNYKQRTIDVFKITYFSAYHNFEFGSGEIRARKAYSVGEGTSLNYSDILRTPQGPTFIVIKRDREFFSASSKKNVVHKEGASVQTSASFSCPQAGCSLSFTSFDSYKVISTMNNMTLKPARNPYTINFGAIGQHDFLLFTRRIVPNQRCTFLL